MNFDLVKKIADFRGFLKPDKVRKELEGLKNLDFINTVIDKFNISYQFPEKDRGNIPSNSPFIVVSNFPYGSLTAIIIIKILSEYYPKIKIAENPRLNIENQIPDYFIDYYFNNSLSTNFGKFSLSSILKNEITQGNSVLIFPEAYQNAKPIADLKKRHWNLPLIQVIKQVEVPIVPIFIKENKKLIKLLFETFNAYSLIDKPEFNKNKTIHLRIGKPISVQEQKEFESVDTFGRYLRTKTYALGSSIEVKKFYFPMFQKLQIKEPIIEPTIPNILEKEVESNSEFLIFSQQNYDVYICPSNCIPNVLNEIGRLRELTFREVGEGTNKSIDLDEYDLYYRHLFMWDREEKKIAGAYRIGKCDEILQNIGKKGLYIDSLFKIDDAFDRILSESIELGRSFIPKEYQAKRLPLFLMWKGIFFFLLSNPQYRYMVGPVSISNQYLSISKSLMVAFINQFYFNTELAQFIKPRKKFEPNLKNIDFQTIIDNTNKDLKKFDKVISDIEPERFTLPVLLKKYLQLNAEIISFNIDPLFNNALDGLLILDYKKVPEEMLNEMRKEIREEMKKSN